MRPFIAATSALIILSFSILVQSSSSINTIVPGGQTCAVQGGSECAQGDHCSGDWLPASDTSHCCSGSCLYDCAGVEGASCLSSCSGLNDCEQDSSAFCADGASMCCVGSCTAYSPPAISGVTSSATNSSAWVAWTTDQDADALLEYGTGSPYGMNSTLNSTPSSGHNVSVSGLAPNTTYHYRAWSCAHGCSSSPEGVFATLPANSSNSSNSSNATPTPTPSPTPPPVNPPADACGPVGASQACQLGYCAGTRTCAAGIWAACVSSDPCCGLDCDDGDACTLDSCASGECMHAYSCASATPETLQQPLLPTPETTLEPSPSETASSEPIDLASLLDQMPAGEEADAMRELAMQARSLDAEGRTEEAAAKWQQLRSMLSAALGRKSESLSSSTLVLAGSAVLFLLGIVAFSAFYAKRPAAAAALGAGQPKSPADRINEIEQERMALLKRFMAREIDYPAYAQMTGSLERELVGLRAGLQKQN